MPFFIFHLPSRQPGSHSATLEGVEAMKCEIAVLETEWVVWCCEELS